jgi:hypothetical protein
MLSEQRLAAGEDLSVWLVLAVNHLGGSSHTPHPDPLHSTAKGEGISSPHWRGEDQGEGRESEPETTTFGQTRNFAVACGAETAAELG